VRTLCVDARLGVLAVRADATDVARGRVGGDEARTLPRAAGRWSSSKDKEKLDKEKLAGAIPFGGRRSATVSCMGQHRRDARLPGEDLVKKGIEDLTRGVESAESLLVSIGAPRLRRLGLAVPEPFLSPEHRLYELLRLEHGDAAHSRYNALVRRLVSFERAAGTTGAPRA